MADETLRAALEPVISVVPWGGESTQSSGFTFKVSTEEQFQHFLKAVGETEK